MRSPNQLYYRMRFPFTYWSVGRHDPLFFMVQDVGVSQLLIMTDGRTAQMVSHVRMARDAQEDGKMREVANLPGYTSKN